MGTVRFGEILGIKLRNEYAGFDTEIYGDPSGDSRAQTDETTPFSILQTQKILAKPAPSNDYTLRREAVAVPLSRLIDGEPGLIISPKCKVTRKGMAGGYCYRRVQVVGDERFHDKPDKNRFSHPCEAGQYLMLGAGEGRTLIKKNPERRQRNQKAVESTTSRWRQASFEGVGHWQDQARHLLSPSRSMWTVKPIKAPTWSTTGPSLLRVRMAGSAPMWDQRQAVQHECSFARSLTFRRNESHFSRLTICCLGPIASHTNLIGPVTYWSLIATRGQTGIA